MLDIRTITGAEIFSPASKMQGGVLHFYFQNGTDLILGIFENGMKKVNLPQVIDALRKAGINISVQEVNSLPPLKMNNPIAKKSKQLLVSVSKSATAFIKPFKNMIVVD